MKGIKEIVKIILPCLFIGCSGYPALDREDYVKYVTNEDNGILATKEINGINYQLQYEPINLKVLKKVKNRAVTVDQYKLEVENFKGSQYFIFKIALKNFQGDLLKYEVKDQSDYSNRVNYFSFQMQHDFYLLEGEDSLKCNLFHFERTYGVSPFCTFVLGFDSRDDILEIPRSLTYKENIKNDKILIYNDQVFGVGTLKFKIKAIDINNIPELTIEYNAK